MFIRLDHGCLLLLALPLAALGASFTVTTHASGAGSVDDTIFGVLGLDPVAG